jgi:hypothetical protein
MSTNVSSFTQRAHSILQNQMVTGTPRETKISRTLSNTYLKPIQTVSNETRFYLPIESVDILFRTTAVMTESRAAALATLEELIQIASNENFEKLLDSEIEELLASSPTDLKSSSTGNKSNMIQILLELNISQFLSSLSIEANEGQEKLYSLMNLIVSLQSKIAEVLVQQQKQAYEEQVKQREENLAAQGKSAIFSGALKILVATAIAAVTTAVTVLTGGAALVPILMAVVPATITAISGGVQIIGGGVVSLNPTAHKDSEILQSMMKNGIAGLITTDDTTARIIKGVYQIIATVVTLGANLATTASNIAEEIIETTVRWVGFAIDVADSAIRVAGQVGSLILSGDKSVNDTLLAIFQGASMGLAGLAISALLSIDQIQQGLIDCFGEQGAMIFSMVLTAIASIASIFIIKGLEAKNLQKGLEAEKSFTENLLEGLRKLPTIIEQLPKAAAQKIEIIVKEAVKLLNKIYASITSALKNASWENFTNMLSQFWHSAKNLIIKLVTVLKAHSYSSDIKQMIQFLKQLINISSPINKLLTKLKKLMDSIKQIIQFIKLSSKIKIPDPEKSRLRAILDQLKDPDQLQKLSITLGINMSVQGGLDNLNYSLLSTINAQLEKDLITSREMANILSESIQTMSTSLELQRAGTETTISTYIELISTLAEAIQISHSQERELVRNLIA